MGTPRPDKEKKFSLKPLTTRQALAKALGASKPGADKPASGKAPRKKKGGPKPKPGA